MEREETVMCAPPGHPERIALRGWVTPGWVRVLFPLMSLAGAVSAQEVTAQSSTFLRFLNEPVPRITRGDQIQAIQFLGIDATGLQSDNLSLHLMGWGFGDLGRASRHEGTSDGDLSYGYLKYRFGKANAEVQAGRFTVAQAGGFEWVDGVSGRADLRGGFTVSAFGGRPVWFRGLGEPNQTDYQYQRDFIAGARVGKRFTGFGEVGMSFLQDGSKPASELGLPSAYDYTRRRAGVDFRVLVPGGIDLTGRTVWDLAKRHDGVVNPGSDSRIAEHEYTASGRIGSMVGLQGEYVARNFRSYFAGTTLPTLFKPTETGTFKAYTGKVTVEAAENLQVLVDYRHSSREVYGDANRVGAEARWKVPSRNLATGFGVHRVSAADAVLPIDTGLASLPGTKVAAFGLSHLELRAWGMLEKAPWSLSLDGLYHHFDDAKHPALAGRSYEYEVIASLGYQVSQAFRVAGDLSLGENPMYRHEAKGLLRIEYRFGTASKKEGK